MIPLDGLAESVNVSLFTREWIEIKFRLRTLQLITRLPLYEGVD